LSTHRPDRTLLNFANDIARIADMLYINRFSVLGLSGGGPYALATAFKFPNRVKSVALIGSTGPATLKE
jgi:pimeloyl-ACP methyl ester carboxylesterase